MYLSFFDISILSGSPPPERNPLVFQLMASAKDNLPPTSHPFQIGTVYSGCSFERGSLPRPLQRCVLFP